MAHYENHYNSKLNRCFIFEDSTLYKKGGGVPFKTLVVVDINENKVFATFDSGLDCTVQGQDCHSEQEWRQLIKPLMEE